MRSRVPVRIYCLIVVLGVAVTVGLNNLLTVINLAKYSEAYQKAAEVLYAPSFGIQILSIGILVPIIEELVFRGIIYRLLRKKLPFLKSMILSALVFGIYHVNLVQFVYAGICGMMLAYLYEKCGAISTPMLGHAVMNITSCTMTQIGGFEWIFARPIRIVLVTIICVVIAFWIFWLFQKKDVTKLLKNHCKPVEYKI